MRAAPRLGPAARPGTPPPGRPGIGVGRAAFTGGDFLYNTVAPGSARVVSSPAKPAVGGGEYQSIIRQPDFPKL